jgi:hypothetical protein
MKEDQKSLSTTEIKRETEKQREKHRERQKKKIYPFGKMITNNNKCKPR